MAKTLYDKLWDSHVVRQDEDGTCLLYIDRHLVHEVTSPQAFEGLRIANRQPWRLSANLATPDHNVPTTDRTKGIEDPISRTQVETLDQNCDHFGITEFKMNDIRQGVVHVVGPEQGATLPGMTVVCGDSHTSTHGAFGALAHGIGTSEVEHVLATQCLIQKKSKAMKVEIVGPTAPGITAKDIVLAIIGEIGTAGGTGYAIEFAGQGITDLSMEGRMTLCNMAIEGGARCGYVNPDQTTYDYLKGRPHAPSGDAWDRAVSWWRSLASGADACFDDEVKFDAAAIAPTITWGITPGQGIGVDEAVPTLEQTPEEDRPLAQEAYRYMDLQPGQAIAGLPVDVCFIGSCTNGRLSDLRAAAAVAAGRQVASGIKAFVVPGSEQVAAAAEAEGLDAVFRQAGFEWREPGCSMCLAMNPDRLEGRQISASSSNRNFKGRQGSASGRTLLMSPAMVAAAAIAGRVTDVRSLPPA